MYNPWAWLMWGVLVNPLVYMSEGMRAAFTDVPHMPLVAVYAALVSFMVVLMWLGLDGFRKRVLT